MLRSTDRILTTHVGSIARPAALLELSSYLIGPPKDVAEYERRLTGAVKDVVTRQVAHISDAPLEAIVDLILRVKAGAYAIEAANPRHEHDWRVWETVKLPEGRILIPGVITHHTVTVEHPRLVADRIVRYARLVGRENVIAGTDCGFSQVDTVSRVHPEVMWATYDALVEGARIASGELWGGRAAA